MDNKVLVLIITAVGLLIMMYIIGGWIIVASTIIGFIIGALLIGFIKLVCYIVSSIWQYYLKKRLHY